MNPEIYIIAGIVIGLLFTELTGLSPGGVIVPGYIALFLHQPLEIILTFLAAAGVMLGIKLLSRLFFIFGRRRFVLCLLLGISLKLLIGHFSPVVFAFPGVPALNGQTSIQLIGWLIPGIMANDMYKQGIKRTLLATAAVTAMVYLLVQRFVYV